MLGSLPILALAALSAVRASPHERRQASTTAAPAAASSSSSSVLSSALSAASSVASAASATAAALNVTGSTSAAMPMATAAANTTADSAYPCPSGYSLGYVTQNITLPLPIGQAVAAFGNWSSSPFFPNVTNITGTNAVGASHVIHVGGGIVALTETLVNVSLGGASGSAAYTWNLTNGPADALGTSLANYSTVLSLYDPGFTATNMTGTNTTALLYTNFCTSGQASTGMPLAAILAAIELGNLAGSVSNSTNITVT